MSFEANTVLGKKCVSLLITPNEPPLSHIIATYRIDRHTYKCIASKTLDLNDQ